ncbi:class I tRNA ligase family protein [Mycolicibacterium pulveris]|uniref:class I tRNA ligase family protein n=1 Tax=Mycolicibacterium pulveris TaxID=36813 RepID=UPI003CEB17EE
MTKQHIDVIFTPPPTPNGGLHVGHLSGPYLRADLNRRLLAAVGSPVAHASHVDSYQTYVAKKARELGGDTADVRAEMSALIRSDFQAFGIHFDQVIDNTADDYRTYLASGLAELFSDKRAIRQPEFVGQDGRYGAVESFVSGTCPNCLQRAFINVCENCGHPMDLTRAWSPVEESTGSTEFVATYDAPLPTVLVIDDHDIAWLRSRYRKISADNPALVKFVAELEPGRITLTFRSDYGYPVAPGRVINPWFEIFFAHCYAVGQLLGLPTGISFDELRRALATADNPPNITYYFGFDNSYYYGVLFPLLARILLVPEMIPTALKANRFLRIGGSKVSSSRGNVVWAHDLAQRCPTIALRGALARVSPELAEHDFREDMLAQPSEWPTASASARHIFDNPTTLTGKTFRSTLERIACPARFSVAELLNRIDNAVKYAGSVHATDAERVELISMVAHMRTVLEI